MTEMEQDKMTQQSLVVFLEQLGAEANDLNSIFKKVIIKIVLSFFYFLRFCLLFWLSCSIVIIIIIFSIFFFLS